MIVTLQYLRALAALMVVYHHCGFQLEKANSSISLPLAGSGAAGVDIFFVISGVIMWITTRSSNATPLQFFIRRLIRIAPLYWCVTLLLLCVSILTPSLLGATRFDPLHALSSAFFIPTYHPRLNGEIVPFFIQGWTLNYEMFFYALFALAMAIDRRHMLTLVLAMLGGWVLLGLLLSPQDPVLRFYSSTLILEFGAGMVLGAIFLHRPKIQPVAAIALILAGAACLLIADSFQILFGPSGLRPERALLWGLPALAIVAGTIYCAGGHRGEGQGAFWLLGEASYSLYLTHIVTLPAVVVLWRAVGLGLDGEWGLAYVLVAMIASALVACATYVLLERPMTDFLRSPREARWGARA